MRSEEHEQNMTQIRGGVTKGNNISSWILSETLYLVAWGFDLLYFVIQKVDGIESKFKHNSYSFHREF